MNNSLVNKSLVLSSVLLLNFMPVLAEETKPKKNQYEDNEIYMRLVLRTPEQLTAFYQGREFNREAIDKILATCYITPIIKNKHFDVLWLELDNWQFFDRNDMPIKRINRDYWHHQWEAINLKQAHRSTFGWTLMPESRDLRFDEGVGGSVVLPWQDYPFTVVARFHTSADKTGPLKTVTFKGVVCKSDIEDNL